MARVWSSPTGAFPALIYLTIPVLEPATRAVQCCELSLYYNSLKICGPEWATGIPEAEKL
jgi:hypothetical protein